MKDIDKAKEIISNWLDLNMTYQYKIDNVEDLGIKISYSESTPMGEWDSNYLIIKNGRIFNSNGDDVLDLYLDANDNTATSKTEIETFIKENFTHTENNNQMKRVEIVKDCLNDNKYVLKQEYKSWGIYERYDNGYRVSQDYFLVNKKDEFRIRIESYNNAEYEELLDAIDNYDSYGQLGFRIVHNSRVDKYDYLVVHPSGTSTI